MAYDNLSKPKEDLYNLISSKAALDETLILEQINQLSDNAATLLYSTFEFLGDSRVKGQVVIDTYGASKFLEVFSKYEFDNMQARLFAFKLALEKSKYAAVPDDLERLAKIMTNSALTDAQKQSLADHRDTHQNLESLDKAIKNIVEPKAEPTFMDSFWSFFGYDTNNELVKPGIADSTTD